MASPAVRARGRIELPFAQAKTSPVSTADVARVIATVLADPAPHRPPLNSPLSPINFSGVAMAALNRANRYDRMTDTVERLTGQPAMSVREFVSLHAQVFGGRS